jgi:hypothetical protein
MANFPKELAQDATYQSHTGRLTGLWFLPKLGQGLNANNNIIVTMTLGFTFQFPLRTKRFLVYCNLRCIHGRTVHRDQDLIGYAG